MCLRSARRYTSPSQPSCPRCTSQQVRERLLARSGTLWSWTIQRFPPKSITALNLFLDVVVELGTSGCFAERGQGIGITIRSEQSNRALQRKERVVRVELLALLFAVMVADVQL